MICKKSSTITLCKILSNILKQFIQQKQCSRNNNKNEFDNNNDNNNNKIQEEMVKAKIGKKR